MASEIIMVTLRDIGDCSRHIYELSHDLSCISVPLLDENVKGMVEDAKAKIRHNLGQEQSHLNKAIAQLLRLTCPEFPGQYEEMPGLRTFCPESAPDESVEAPEMEIATEGYLPRGVKITDDEEKNYD